MKPIFTKTKIIATIGPACLTKNILRKMVHESMDCARINTAHGDFSQYELIIKLVREAGDIPVMIDIKGPEIRIRTEKEIFIKAREKKQFGFKKGKLPYFSYDISRNLSSGDNICFDNGLIKAKVVKIKKGTKPTALLSFRQACTIKPNKGVNIPGKRLNVPALSAKDKAAIKFAIKHKLSFIALSFARDKEDVLRVRKLLGNASIGIIAKIENAEGIKNIDELIAVSDGIMVARGDLGVEIPLQKIPYLQKMIVRKCNAVGKIVVVATQMLESMTNSFVPTRAEVSDVANAVLDGADAVMLSGETAAGKYPVKAVETMRTISSEIEDKIESNVEKVPNPGISDEMSEVASHLATSAKATKLVCITRSGFTARLIARFRPNMPILAVTDLQAVMLQMKLAWGVFPILMKPIPVRTIMANLAYYLFDNGFLTRKDRVVFVGGIRTMQSSISNVVEIHDIDDLLKYKKKFLKN